MIPGGRNRWEERFGMEQLLLPGVHNALAARLAEETGFRSVFVTGSGVANNFLGEPDLGFLTLDQLKAHVEQICYCTTVPVFVDFDAGYGDAKLAYRNARQFVSLGVTGIFIEDQVQPKRCGHLNGKQIIHCDEMEMKIGAVRRVSDDLIIVARTDALAVEGEQSAFERVRHYHDAGADVTFVEAPTSLKQLKRIANLPWPQVVNIVEGGKTPELTADELRDLQFSIVLFADFASRMAMRSMQIAYKTLFAQGDTSMLVDEMMSFGDRQKIVGLRHWECFDEVTKASYNDKS